MKRTLEKLRNFTKGQWWGKNSLTGFAFVRERFLGFCNPRKIRKNFQKIPKIDKKCGAVVLELALSIPVFLALLYYMHDVPRLQELKSRSRFVTFCGINMLQNMTMKRADKRVTIADFIRVTCIAEMPFVGGGTAHYSSTVSGVSPRQIQNQFTLFYVKGISSTKARIYWGITNNGCGNPKIRNSAGLVTSGTPSWQWVTVIKAPIGKDVDQSSIHKDLHLQAGEAAMIVDNTFFPRGSLKYNPKKLFGFLIYTPKPPAQNEEGVFHSVVIFAPKPGLFSENPSEGCL